MSIIDFWLEAKVTIDSLIEQFLAENKDWELVDLSSYILKDGKRFRGTLSMFLPLLWGEIMIPMLQHWQLKYFIQLHWH